MARPRKSNVGNLKATQRSTQTATQINTDVEISKLTYDVPEKKTFCCTACGRSFKKQETNFCKSFSPLFANNNGFVSICKKCTDKHYYNLVDFFSGNEEKAMDRMCQIFDWYYSDEIFAVTRKITSDKSRVCAYPAKMNLPQYEARDKTYADTISDRANNVIGSVDELEKINADEQVNITKAMFERWGQVSPDDIIALDDHYKMLKKQNPNCDNNQEIFIKDLCYTKILQMKAFRSGNSADFEKYTKLYRDTFKQAGLKTVQEDDGSNENTLGVNAAIIAQYTPEEFYKDKKLYKDFDKIGEYFERHVLRPLRNMEFGDNKRDAEYNVGDANEDE